MNTNGSIVASGFRSYAPSPECVGATPDTNRTVSGSCASFTVSNSRSTTVRCAMRGRQAEPQAGRLRARPRRGSGLTGVRPKLIRVEMVLEFVYEGRTESNPERTDSPTHIRPDLSADPDPLHLAAAAAALDQDRGGGARVGRIAVSPLEQALVGLGILSGVSTSGGRPLQLGVRRD